MGTYTNDIPWTPTEMVHIVPAYDDKPTRIGWGAVGITDTEFARKFAEDLLKKCDRVDAMNSG